MCGERVLVEGTSPCSCVLTAVEEVDAIFDAVRPRQAAGVSRRTEERTPQPADGGTGGAEESGEGGDTEGSGEGRETGRPRMGRRGKGVVVGLVAAVTLGAGALTVEKVSTGPDVQNDVQNSGRASVPSPSDRGAAPPEPADGPETPSASGEPPGRSGSSDFPDSAMSHQGGEVGEGGAEHHGPQSPAPPHDEAPSPSSPGDAAGGTSPGGGSSNGGSGAGGSSDGGSTGDPGEGEGGSPDGGGSQGGGGEHGDGGGESGGLLGGLLGGLFGGGGDG